MSFIKTLAAVLLMSYSLSFAWADVVPEQRLPLPPKQMPQASEYVAVTTLDSAKELETVFAKQGYLLSADNQLLPRIYVENLPADLNSLPVAQKVSVFIRLLLPTIKAVNQQILQIRQRLIALSTTPWQQWTQVERKWFTDLLANYAVNSELSKNNSLQGSAAEQKAQLANAINTLLLRVDVIPSGMVLAQAIDESGWGTSYFAVAGNNLYGEHLSEHGGKFLTTPNGKVKVAAFDNLFQSTASYIHNLNTTRAYSELRQLRQVLRQQNKLSGYELTQGLIDYSSRGQAYVDNLRALITAHQLDNFTNAKLLNTRVSRYRFSRPVAQ